jgi:hypothetical protein
MHPPHLSSLAAPNLLPRYRRVDRYALGPGIGSIALAASQAAE